jgi:glutathione synthase/RimK-type ligase-like ATP-grasp enzyme
MTRQFLVITSSRSVSTRWEKREAYVREFYAELEAKLEDVTVRYTTYDDITYLVQDGQVHIYDTRHQLDLKKVDIVHFKNWMFDSEPAATIARYLRQYGVKFFNSEVDAGLAWGKLSQMCYLALEGLPVPDTYFAKKAHLVKGFESQTLPEGFTLPLIIKADDGAKGNDNHLVATWEEALEVLQTAEPDKEFVVQTFLPNDGDYRFLFIGLDQEPLVFHRQAVGDSHLNNTSKGGQGTFIDPKSLPVGYFELARRAAQIVGREISGADLLVDKITQKVYVLEVNSTPALATGYGVERKNDRFAAFLQRQLAVDKPEATKKTVIGRADHITFLDGEVYNLPAKIDTGAYRSSVWATDIEEHDGVLYFTLLGPASPCYSGKRLQTKEYRQVQVENSFGHKQQRYSVFLSVEIAGRKIRSNFTLANRGSKTYSALIGRKMLKSRFIVDVSAGKPLADEDINGDDSLA